MNKLSIQHLALPLLLCILGAGTANATESHCGKPLSIASSSVGRSMVVGKNGALSGTVKDFMDKVSVDTGCTFDYKQVPRARAWMLLSTRAIDLLPAAVQSTDRDQIARFVPTHRVTPQLLTLDAKLPAIRDSNALLNARLRVGVVRGYQYGQQYQHIKAQLAQRGLLDEVANPETIIKMLQAGRIQATILPLTALADAAENMGVGKDLRAASLAELPQVRAGIYFSRDTVPDQAFSALDQTIRRLVQRGDYDRFMRQHYPAWSLKGVQRG